MWPEPLHYSCIDMYTLVYRERFTVLIVVCVFYLSFGCTGHARHLNFCLSHRLLLKHV